MVPSNAQLKLARAREHIDAVTDLVDDWLDGPDFGIEQITAADGRIEVRVRLSGSPPPQIAVVAGEAVHALLSALDNAVYASALQAAGGALDEKTERDLEFPMLRKGTTGDFDRRAGRKLVGVPEAVRRVIEAHQPYRRNTDEEPKGYRFHWIWKVHDLDRIDKHRRLALTAAALRHAGVGSPAGVEPEAMFFHLHGPVVHDQRIASWLADDLGVAFMHDRDVSLVDDPGAGATGSTLGETLDSLFGHVQWLVGQMEWASRRPPS